MLSESQVAEFHAKGYLKGGRVLSDAEVEELRGELHPQSQERHPVHLLRCFRCQSGQRHFELARAARFGTDRDLHAP